MVNTRIHPVTFFISLSLLNERLMKIVVPAKRAAYTKAPKAQRKNISKRF
jgi:hypothetical protein